MSLSAYVYLVDVGVFRSSCYAIPGGIRGQGEVRPSAGGMEGGREEKLGPGIILRRHWEAAERLIPGRRPLTSRRAVAGQLQVSCSCLLLGGAAVYPQEPLDELKEYAETNAYVLVINECVSFYADTEFNFLLRT